MSKFKFTVPAKTTDLIFPVQQFIQETGKLRSIYRTNGLSATQGQILVCLDRCGPMTIVGLTAELGLDKSTISQTLATLQSNGLIELKENGDDRRFKHAQLSEAGKSKVYSVNDAFDRALKRMVSSLSEQDLNTIGYGLLKFVELLKGHKEISFKRIMGAAKAPGAGHALFNLD